MDNKFLDYETYWIPGKESFGNLNTLLDLFNEVSREYKAVIFPPARTVKPQNKELFKVLKDFPERDRFVPCAYINPNLYDAVEELETAVKKYGFRGMKLMPTIHRYLVDSEVTYPVMEKCYELGIPVTIHSSSEGGYPNLISNLAEEFPKVPIIMDHSGYRYFQNQALEAGKRNRNIYFGMSCVIEPSYIESVADNIGADKVIFGSNAQGGIPKIGILVYEYTGLSEKDKESTFGKNLAKLLKLRM